MHYVNLGNKSKQTLIRFLLYGFLGLIIGALTIVLVLIVQGYSFDRKTGQVIQNGLILADSVPEGASVRINGQDEGKKTPARMPVPAGRYSIDLSLNGYRSWSRTFNLAGSEVVWLDYPIFVPEKLQTETVATLPKLRFAEMSSNKKFILAAQSNREPRLNLYEYDGSTNIETRQISIPESLLTKQKNALGLFDFVEWGPNNKHVLLKHTNNKIVEYIWLDVTKPQEAINVTKQFSLALTAVGFSGDADQLVVLEAGNIRRANLDNKTITPALASGVLEFKKAKDDVFYFIAQSQQDAPFELFELDSEVYKLASSDKKMSTLDYTEYDSNRYLALRRGNNDVLVYRNLSREETEKNVPEKTINMQRIDSLEFSERGRFLMSRAGTTVRVFDVELKRDYSYGLPEAKGAQALAWLDEHHLTFMKGSTVMLMDFDGNNRFELSAADPRFPINIDTKKNRIFSVGTANKQTVLQRTELLIPK